MWNFIQTCFFLHCRSDSQLKQLEEEREQLNTSLSALTTHFAQVLSGTFEDKWGGGMSQYQYLIIPNIFVIFARIEHWPFNCLCSVDPFSSRLVNGERLGGKRLTGPICPSLFPNPFTARLAQPGHFVISLCLMPDDFTHQWRVSGWERVNWAYLPISVP